MSFEKAVEAVEPFLGGRARRLLEANEPELCEGIRAAVAAGATPEEVRKVVLSRIGRRDTALMAYYYAVWLTMPQVSAV